MLWHNLSNVPFNSSHQEQHLFIVNGLGCNNPVDWFPQFTGCRHSLREGWEKTGVCWFIHVNEHYVSSQNRWVRQQNMVSSEMDMLAALISLIAKYFWERNYRTWHSFDVWGKTGICLHAQLKCQVNTHKKRKYWGKSCLLSSDTDRPFLVLLTEKQAKYIFIKKEPFKKKRSEWIQLKCLFSEYIKGKILCIFHSSSL